MAAPSVHKLSVRFMGSLRRGGGVRTLHGADQEAPKGTLNHPTLVAQIAPALMTAFGQGVVSIPASAPGFSGSEDFSELGALSIPSAYLMIGGDTLEKLAEYKVEGITPPTNHSPLYAPVSDRLSHSGTTALVMSVR